MRLHSILVTKRSDSYTETYPKACTQENMNYSLQDEHRYDKINAVQTGFPQNK